MKKVLSTLLVCIMGVGLLSSCNSGSSQTPAPQASASQPAQASSAAPAQSPSATPSPSPVVEEPAKAEPHGVYKTYSTTTITNLNPFENGDSDAGDLISGSSVKPYMQVPGEDGNTYKYVGEFAADMPKPLNDDQTEWLIPLREDVFWEDGVQVTSKDLVYSAKMCLDPLLLTRRGPSFAVNYVTVANAEEYMAGNVEWEEVGFQADGDFAIKVTTADFAVERDILQHFSNKWNVVVREDLFESCMADDRTANTYGTEKGKWMSCGRFILKDIEPGVHYTMVRNDNYIYPDMIKLEGYELRIVKDANTALELFLNNEIDQVNLSATSKQQYEDDPRIWMAPGASVYTMTINRGNTTQNNLLGNLNFRQALFYAMDRDAIARIVSGIPANYILGQKVVGDMDTTTMFRDMPGSSDYLADKSYDPDKAKELYDLALSELGLSSASIEILLSETSANYKGIAEMLQVELPKIFGDTFSVSLNLQASNTASSMRKAWAKGETNSYEVTFVGWDTSSVAPWNAMKVYCQWYGGRNEPVFNDEYDALWEQANNSREAKLDNDLRISLTQQMEKIALDDVFVIPLYETPVYKLINERIELPVEKYLSGFGWGFMFSTIND